MSKVRIFYNSYPNCPEATEYSARKARSGFYQGTTSVALFFLGLTLSFIDSNDRWLAIAMVVISVLWGLYLIFLRPRRIQEELNEIVLCSELENPAESESQTPAVNKPIYEKDAENEE